MGWCVSERDYFEFTWQLFDGSKDFGDSHFETFVEVG